MTKQEAGRYPILRRDLRPGDVVFIEWTGNTLRCFNDYDEGERRIKYEYVERVRRDTESGDSRIPIDLGFRRQNTSSVVRLIKAGTPDEPDYFSLAL